MSSLHNSLRFILFICIAAMLVCCEDFLRRDSSFSPQGANSFDTFYQFGVESEQEGNYDLASSYFQEALKYLDDKNSQDAINAYNHIGQIAVQQGNREIAMENFSKTMLIHVRSKDIAGQASAYCNIGTAYHMDKDYVQAQKNYEESLKLHTSLNNELGQADCYNNMGALALDQNKPVEALEYFLESEKIYLKNDTHDKLWNVYHNIGMSYHEMNSTEMARKYYNRMKQLSDSISSMSKLAETYFIIGTFFDDIQQTDSAIYYLSKAIDIAYISELYELLHNACNKRSHLYARAERFSEAYRDRIIHDFAYQEMYNKDKTRAFVLQSEHHKFEMQRQEQLHRHRLQRTLNIGLSIVLILAAVVGIVSYRAYVQKKKANILLARQKEEITDSIHYAGVIQKATLPAKEYSDSVLPNYFIYYKPRDIVSGDFYWIDRRNDHIIVAVADCTGHGVPGAIVSMLGISSLKKIVGKMKIPKADEILNELRNEIIRLLNPEGSADKRQDGMDIALTIIDTKKHEIEFAGAFNPLYLVRDEQLIEKKADRMPIGLHIQTDIPFTANRFEYKPEDIIYMFSDGYADQFGGPKNTKFKTKNLKSLLLDISRYPLDKQVEIIDRNHLEWRGTTPQLDDILVVGIKL